MVSPVAETFRLAVLNPGGRDREQHFADEATVTNSQHAPVNFHAYAACTNGAVFRQTRQAIATGWPVLLLLRGDFRQTEQALTELKRAGRVAAVAFKETGAHQIGQQLGEPSRLARFRKIVQQAGGCITSTPQAAEFFMAFRQDGIGFIPTPYPIEFQSWNFATEHRHGIFVGTREFEVPSRNHLRALLAAKRLSALTNEPVTVFNLERNKGRKLIRQIGFGRICMRERPLPYRAYLAELARHKIVFQLDRSRVPGQVAGDTLLVRGVCVGGDGAIESIAFPESCGVNRSDSELIEIAMELLRNDQHRAAVAARAVKIAGTKLSFQVGRENLARFFSEIGA